MGTRSPAARLPTGNRPLTTQDVSGVLRHQRANPLSDSVLVEGLQTDGTTNVVFLKHGLGRSFVGVFPVGQDRATSTALAFVSPAEVQRLGQDPSVYFAVRASTASVVTFNAVVF